jgi:hypothetical protein
MIVLNFSHPLSAEAVQQLTEKIGEFEARSIRVQLDMLQPLSAQVEQVADSVGFTPAEWQTQPFVVVLPGASVATGLLLAEIHGRSGGFPRIVSLVSGEDRVFRLGEVIDLTQVRNNARTRR